MRESRCEVSWLVNGLPLHPLFVHATVVGVPVVALLTVGAGWNNRIRKWLGVVLPSLASVAFVGALITKQAGEALAAQVASTPAVHAHVEIADIAVAGAFLLLLVTWGRWVWSRRRARAHLTEPKRYGRVAVALAVVETVVAVFAIVGIVVAGDTGARAVWAGSP